MSLRYSVGSNFVPKICILNKKISRKWTMGRNEWQYNFFNFSDEDKTCTIYIYISFLLGVGIAETTMVKNCSGNFPSTQNYSGNL